MKKKKAPKVVQSTKHRNLVELFLKTLSALYPNDNLMPGITISWLPEKIVVGWPDRHSGGCFYGSVRRFDNPTQAQRIVHFEASTLDDLFLGLVNLWTGKSADVIAFQTALLKRKGANREEHQATAKPARRRR
jgi:hypothetical protein